MIKIKTPEQIEGIRKSCKLAAQTLKFIDPYVIPGVSTGILDQLIHDFIKDHGAIPATLGYKGYNKSSCISINEVICHGIPNENTFLKEGDIVNVDVTTILNGYYGDTSKMFPVGAVSNEAQALMDITHSSMLKGILEVRPGNYFGNIGHAITNYAEEKGYSVVFEFCGHGVGIDFHEDPQISHYVLHKDTGPRMKENMTFTIEPMINQGKAKAIICEADKWTARTIDGLWSAQFEHTVLVTSNGVEVLTQL